MYAELLFPIEKKTHWQKNHPMAGCKKELLEGNQCFDGFLIYDKKNWVNPIGQPQWDDTNGSISYRQSNVEDSIAKKAINPIPV